MSACGGCGGAGRVGVSVGDGASDDVEVACPDCGGSGEAPAPRFPIPLDAAGYSAFRGDAKFRELYRRSVESTPSEVECPECNGGGTIEIRDNLGVWVTILCPLCNGRKTATQTPIGESVVAAPASPDEIDADTLRTELNQLLVENWEAAGFDSLHGEPGDVAPRGFDGIHYVGAPAVGIDVVQLREDARTLAMFVIELGGTQQLPARVFHAALRVAGRES